MDTLIACRYVHVQTWLANHPPTSSDRWTCGAIMSQHNPHVCGSNCIFRHVESGVISNNYIHPVALNEPLRIFAFFLHTIFNMGFLPCVTFESHGQSVKRPHVVYRVFQQLFFFFFAKILRFVTFVLLFLKWVQLSRHSFSSWAVKCAHVWGLEMTDVSLWMSITIRERERDTVRERGIDQPEIQDGTLNLNLVGHD